MFSRFSLRGQAVFGGRGVPRWATCVRSTASAGKGASPAPGSSSVLFYVNGERVSLSGSQLDADSYLIDVLRARGLTGAKLACGEGGCGACTVMVTRKNARTGQLEYRSLNSCLAAAPSLHGCHVTTVEGIGGGGDPVAATHRGDAQPADSAGGPPALHPVQTALADSFASQCGFCTPGFVMALYAAQCARPEASVEQLEKAIDGNLCRCTGYRPILDAVQKLAADAPGARAAGRLPPPPPFPQELAELAAEGPVVDMVDGHGRRWLSPTSLVDLLDAKSREPRARVIQGNTEVAIEQRFGRREYPSFLSPTHVPELHVLLADPVERSLRFGAAVSLTELWEFCERVRLEPEGTAGVAANEPPANRRALHAYLDAICDQIYWFSGTAVRNGASLGGNVATASPISDLNPVWMALGAQFVLASRARGQRTVAAADFFLGYRQVDMAPDELLVEVRVPWADDAQQAGRRTLVRSFKQSQRREDDIAVVTACLRVTLDAEGDGEARVADCALAYGGVGPRTERLESVERLLRGQLWTRAAVDHACAAMDQQLAAVLHEDASGGRPQFRRALAQSFLLKFYLDTVGQGVGQDASDPDHRQRSGAQDAHWAGGPVRSRQTWAPRPDAAAVAPVGEPAAHTSARRQVTGLAEYTDDIAPRAGELHAALVLSDRPHADLLGVRTEQALAVPGAVAYYGAADVPGTNTVGDIVQDEQVFASGRVVTVGQIIGVVVAESERAARAAARLVEVRYGQDHEPVLTIDQARRANSYHALADGAAEHCIMDGGGDGDGAAAMEQALRDAPHQVAGEVRLGGQEHFYFEPMVTVAEPVDGEMVLTASTQNCHKTQETAAHVLGLPMHKVTCAVRRLGGGFGGKETSNILPSCAAALAAHCSGRPVRLVMGRDEDMIHTGKRHPFQAEYRVGFDDDGRLLAVDMRLWSNGGWSYDLSGPVLDRALFHSDNAYWAPVRRVRGRICRTNLPSNTAFRGFGGPQGMLACEAAIEHVAHALGVRPEVVRARNLYQPGQRTHFGQPVVGVDIPRLFEQAKLATGPVAASACLVGCGDGTTPFDRLLEQTAHYNRANRWRKRGVSLLPSKFGLAFTFTTLNQGSALVHIYTDGSIVVTHGGVEMGQGLHTKVQQCVAHELGVPLSQVYLQGTSTEKIANSSATAASMGSDLYAMAAAKAARELNDRLKPFRQSGQASFEDAVVQAWLQRVSLSAQGFHAPSRLQPYPFVEGGRGHVSATEPAEPEPADAAYPFSYFTCGAVCSVAEVDTLTGDSRLLRTDIVMDVGTSLNPAIDVGQIEGAFVQGFGWLALEQMIVGQGPQGDMHRWVRSGHLHQPGPGAYKLPAADDIPREFSVTLAKDTEATPAVHSSRGIGEPPILLAASGLFAIRDAMHQARLEHSSGEADWLPVEAPITSERIRLGCTDHIVSQLGEIKIQTNV